jgi:hypothetical protein
MDDPNLQTTKNKAASVLGALFGLAAAAPN